MKFARKPVAIPAIARISFRLCASFSLTFLLAYPAVGQSLADPAVRLGSATITGLGTPQVRITQGSAKAVIDWRAFSVDAGASVVFAQPDASAIVLNRVTGTGESRIDGSLTANGQMWLLNPNGVLIGARGRVETGGFLATTHALSNDDFAAGKYGFEANGASAGVVNFGQIVSAQGGYAILAGNASANAGLVQARLGQVVLGAGKGFVLDIAGDKLLSFAVTQPLNVVPAGGAPVENIGVLSAAGGQVLLTAKSAADVVGGVINTSGLIDATAARLKGGQIVLDGGGLGSVAITGILDASGKGAGQSGGAIKVFGNTAVVGDKALLDARGMAGGGDIHVGGGWQGAQIDGHPSSVRAAVASTATLDASALGNGNGGTIVLWSDVNNPSSMTIARGTFYARGGENGGNGGRIETSGRYLVTEGVRGSASAAMGNAGLWLFDPYNVEIVAPGTGGPGGAGPDSAGPGVNIVNPGFEQGLTGWSLINGGNTQVVTSVQALNGQTYYSQVSSGGNFALITGASANTNYGITQTFSGKAGQSFGLYALFIGGDYLPYNDYGRVTLTQPDGQTITLYTRDISAVGTNGTAPWELSTVKLSQTGNFTIQAFAANLLDSVNNSSLGFELASASSSSSSANGAFSGNSGTQVWTPTGNASKIDVSHITSLLNAGTNVRITTGTAGAGAEAGNITVSAAIAKSAGADTSLQLDALGGIAVNQAITSSSNRLNVTLNADLEGIALNAAVGTNGGALTLNSTGSVTQKAAFTTDTLTLTGTGGTHTLMHSGNSFKSVSADTGSVALANDAATTRLSGVTTSGALKISGSGNLLLDGSVKTGGTSELKAAGQVTISGTGSINAAAETAIVAGTNFVNQAGANAIITSNAARWLVYSNAPSTDTFGGLVSGNLALWGTSFSALPPASITATGNRYVFSTSPTVTITATSAHKIYGNVLSATSARPFASSGIVDAGAYGKVFSQDVLTGAPAFSSAGDTERAAVGTYTIAIGKGGLSGLTGYTFDFVTGQLTVDPKALLAALSGTVAKTYDGSTAATLASGNYTLTGTVAGDNVALNNPTSGSYADKNAGTAKTVSVGGLALSGADAGNYTVNSSASGSVGKIDPKALTAALIGTVAKTYDGGTAATLTSGNFVLTGFVSGESATVKQTLGQYAAATPGTGISVFTTLSDGQVIPSDGTLLSNYVLPVGSVSGLVGTITPIVTVPPPPPEPVKPPQPAPAPAPAPGPVTSSPAPAPEPPAPASSNTPASGNAPTLSSSSVKASPPSPVPAEKPPTPKDAADNGDPILASVDETPADKPAPNATRQNTESTSLAGGLLSAQRSLPPYSPDVPGIDQGFSGSGNVL